MSKQDYDRASRLQELVRDKVFRDAVHPFWLPNGNLSYQVKTSLNKFETWIVDVSTGAKVCSSDTIRPNLPILAPKSVPNSGNSSIETEITFVNDLDEEFQLSWIDWEGNCKEYHVIKTGEIHQQHTFSSHAWMVTRFSDKLPICGFVASAVPSLAPIRDARGSEVQESIPDPTDQRQWKPFMCGSNVCVRHEQSSKTVMLTRCPASFQIYNEHELYLSPNGKKLVAMKTVTPEYERYIHLLETSPNERLEPKFHRIRYPKPGDPVPQKYPHLFDIIGKNQIQVSDHLFMNSYELSAPQWESNSERFFIIYNKRGHQLIRVIAVNASTGHTEVVVEEVSNTFIDYAGKQFIRYLDETREIIWMSERDGWNHLYLYDTQKGVLKNQITHGEWVVRGVQHVDKKTRQIIFTACGVYQGQDPYYIHYCRVNFDGTGFTLLTRGDGTHSVEFSPCKKYFIDTYSRVDLPPVVELHKAHDGSLITVLEVAHVSGLQSLNWKMPMRFVSKGRDGTTDIYGVIFRPTNLNPNRKYPIIEDIYAGPQDSHVPKNFSAFHELQGLAELGFIVVVIDGMGTSNRSKSFHDVCYKNLGDAGLPDRILWIQAAARKYPYMDIQKVGIYGISAGGQNAMRAMLMYPEFYKVGVSASGCHDNRMDKLWWNELWMGWPVGPHYEEQSNVTQAHRLKGKLLLIVCEMDDNVDPASTYQVVNALVKADKDFDLLVIPGEGHGLGGEYGKRRMQDFFVRNLLGVEPKHN